MKKNRTQQIDIVSAATNLGGRRLAFVFGGNDGALRRDKTRESRSIVVLDNECETEVSG